MFLIKNVDLLYGSGYLKNDNNRLNLGFKNLLEEQNEEYLHHFKNPTNQLLKRFYISKWKTILII